MQNRSTVVRGQALAVAFAATVLVSAFLLFQVQPLLSKLILPWFGGSPAVWTTCMLFFQVLLFGGYAYAHLSEHVFGRRTRTLVHLGLIAAGLALLPVAPDLSWKPTSGQDPTWRILCLLAASVGIPYFVLSSTGPLVQGWFSRAYPGRSPYRLYSLSNAGSLAALLSYPFVFEPMLDAHAQSQCWSWGFGLFAICCGCAVISMRHVGSWRAAALPNGEQAAPATRPRAIDWLLWLALPAFASLTLLATTNHVCQDVAVIPFLWVVPLSLYLLSFIICFDHERWYKQVIYGVATVLLTLRVAMLDAFSASFLQELALCFAAMFGVCMLCHGELVRRRPAARYLTSFYLMIAAGGALGGILVSLVAPLVFHTFFEWKICLVGGYFLAAALVLLHRRDAGAARQWYRLLPAAALALAGLIAVVYYQTGSKRIPVFQARNFYGEVTVLERAADEPQEHDFVLYSGGIIHGVQFACDEKRRLPTTYYSLHSGVGLALAHYRDQKDLRIGAIGLGVGTLAAYPRAGQYLCFYEINPAMVHLAKTNFSYLQDCRGQVETVLGDARLSLESEPPQRFDVLVLDAFTGDAVPTHLLTKEAFAVYLRHLVPGGVICVHITNTYLDLAPVVRAAAKHHDLDTVRVETTRDRQLELYRADWMLLTKNKELLAELAPSASPDPQPAKELLWTDHYSNLFQILK